MQPSHVPNVESEREAAISTSCMSSLHAFVHNLAAPSIALKPSTEIGSKKISKSGFEIRQEKILVLINNAVRALNSPRNTFPVFESVGKDLSTTITASQLNRIASDWGVSTTHSTATETNGRECYRMSGCCWSSWLSCAQQRGNSST